MKTFTVRARPGHDSRWWVLVCDEARCVSQCRRLSSADTEMREAIAEFAGLPLDGFNIKVEVSLRGELDTVLDEFHQAQEAEKAATLRLKEKSRRAAHALVQAGITQRDAAQLMGISNQRVSQLINA